MDATKMARAVRRAMFYEKQSEDESADNEVTLDLELPDADGISELGDQELQELHNQFLEAFNALYEEASEEPSDEQVETLSALADGIDTLRGAIDSREQASAERREAAAALSERVSPVAEDSDASEEGADESGSDEESGEDFSEQSDNSEDSKQEEAVTASGARRVTLRGLRAQRGANQPKPKRREKTMRDVVFAAPDVPGLSNGQGVTWGELAKATSRRLASFPEAQYRNAAKSGRHQRQQFSLGIFKRDTPNDLKVTSDSPEQSFSVMQRAMDEKRLPGGSLVASGGWCAPSENLYDLCELETRDGILDLPEFEVTRGGINYTRGPDFTSLYEDTGFSYTESEDEDGNYDGDGGGEKPCFKVDCPDWQDERLNVAGVCITAGLLQNRAYPEMTERTLRGAMVAHDHRVNAAVINSIASGSESISMPSDQVGATAPALTAVELHVQHMKDLNRMSESASIEGVFPFWLRGAIRADLARRLGVDLIDVPNERIDAWFAQRGIAPQYVYDWQSISTTSRGDLTQFPDEVKFLLYPAGTWVKGVSDIITLDTVYDSAMLGTNDFTGLFTEEGWLTARMCHDSREITVPLCADGATHAGVAIECDGTEADEG